MIIDWINGGFESVGAILSFLNLRRLLADKHIAGVQWQVTAFWAAWGLWNLVYYPALGQWLSFSGGVLLVASNLTWVALAIRYTRKPIWRP
jgi:hypothetical protein